MDKAKKAILALLKTHQPMMVTNLVKIVSNETGSTATVVEAYKELDAEESITTYPNGLVVIKK